MRRDFHDFSRALWQLPELTCHRCEVTATYAEDDDPERCSCGAAYDLRQYDAEQAEARADDEWRVLAGWWGQ